MKFCLVVPTYNAGPQWDTWLHALRNQSVIPDKTLVIDSSSLDDTANKAEAFGLKVIRIKKEDFNHGGTRQLALNQCLGYEVVVFLTQDAILSQNDSLQNVLKPFEDISVGAVCGRQLPRREAEWFEYFERSFNYPSVSSKRAFDDRHTYGVKTPFISNSFAAYRSNALREVGGFPLKIIIAEDMYVAAKMLLAGWSIYYCSEAAVYHSHNYNFREVFGRYFDTGVFHSREPWIQEKFGTAGGEGVKYAVSEVQYLWNNKPSLIPYSIFRNGVKFLGYRLGKLEGLLPRAIKRTLSMHRDYW